jgi:hypothetical protein
MERNEKKREAESEIRDLLHKVGSNDIKTLIYSIMQ